MPSKCVEGIALSIPTLWEGLKRRKPAEASAIHGREYGGKRAWWYGGNDCSLQL